jgi:hypothetical protein
VAIYLGKKNSLKILRKNSFQVLGVESGPLRRTVREFMIFISSDFFGKRFRENALPGGLSADPRRTVCYSLQNRVLLGGPGGRSAACPRTVRMAQADGPRGPGGRSARPNGQPPQSLISRFYRWNSKADSPRGHRG